MQKRKHTGNMGIYLIGGGIYVGLLILFGFQTWQFVDWLFPNDQMLMKLLTVLCFDVMALFWACADLFYRFASKSARTLVRWAWAISFILSLLASIFYLVIESMFRFQVTITQTTVNIGYGVTIFALTLNILFLTFWLYLEWSARHPQQDEYAEPTPEEERIRTVVLSQMPQPTRSELAQGSTSVLSCSTCNAPAIGQLHGRPYCASHMQAVAESYVTNPVPTSPLAPAPTSNQDENNPMFEAFKRGINGAH